MENILKDHRMKQKTISACACIKRKTTEEDWWDLHNKWYIRYRF